MTSRTGTVRLLTLAAVAALLLPATGCDTPCNCDWEGPVLFRVTALWADAEALYVAADVEWQPCCESRAEDSRFYRIDAATGASQAADTRPADGEVAIPAGPSEVPVPFAGPGTTVTVRLDVEDSVTTEDLAIGSVRRDSDGEEIAEVRVDVRQR